MSELKHLSGEEGQAEDRRTDQRHPHCMMITAASDGSFDCRPMATQKTEFDGTVWFLTRQESGKVAEIHNDSHVSLIYADPGDHNYVSAKGRATRQQDKAKIHELWNPMYKAWFPEGEDDPAIAVSSDVDVTEAQYWEASSSSRLWRRQVPRGRRDRWQSGSSARPARSQPQTRPRSAACR